MNILPARGGGPVYLAMLGSEPAHRVYALVDAASAEVIRPPRIPAPGSWWIAAGEDPTKASGEANA